MIDLLRQRPENDPETVTRLKGWARELLGLGEDVTVTVIQLTCAEDDCPDMETVVGVLEPGNPRKYKVLKPLTEVTLDDLAAAFRQPTSEP